MYLEKMDIWSPFPKRTKKMNAASSKMKTIVDFIKIGDNMSC